MVTILSRPQCVKSVTNENINDQHDENKQTPNTIITVIKTSKIKNNDIEGAKANDGGNDYHFHFSICRISLLIYFYPTMNKWSNA